MPKKTIYEMSGVLVDEGEVRTGTTRKEEPYAARTIFVDLQDGGEPLGLDYYRQGEQAVWVDSNFKFTKDDLVRVEFTIAGDVFVTDKGYKIPKTKLRVWKIVPLNDSGRVTAKKRQQPQDESDDEDSLPF